MTLPDIWTLSPEALRGYAVAMEEACGIATNAEHQIYLSRMSDIAEGFADRLGGQQRTAEPAPTPMTRERVAAWGAKFEAAALRTPPTPAEPDDASEDWRGLGEHIFPPPPEAPAEAAQEGLADAAAESLATPAKAAANPAQRSDSPWTEERLALLARIYPTIMSLEAMREALMVLPGLEIATVDAVKMKAQRLELHRRGHPIPEEFADAAAVRVRNLGGLANNGGKPGTWTPERVALLRRDYPGKRPLAEILADVNALAGPAVPTIEAVAAHAKKAGLSRRQPPEVGPAIPGPPEVMTTEDKAEARERLRTGQARGARDIMEWFGCTQDEAQEIVDAHRTRMGKAA